MQSDGKVPAPVCARAGAWLRRVASSSPRAVLGISEPTEAELKKQAAFRGKARAAGVIWVTYRWFDTAFALAYLLTWKLCGVCVCD